MVEIEALLSAMESESLEKMSLSRGVKGLILVTNTHLFCKSCSNQKVGEEFITIFHVALLSQQKIWEYWVQPTFSKHCFREIANVLIVVTFPFPCIPHVTPCVKT